MELNEEIKETLEKRYEELSKGSSKDEKRNYNSKSFFIFRINDNLFAVMSEDVDEISEFVNPTPLPNCESHIVGIINVRGAIIGMVDIRKFINEAIGDNFLEEVTRLIICDNGQFKIAILIHEMLEKKDMENSDLKSVDFEGTKGSILTGFIPYQGKDVQYINLKKFLSNDELIINQ